MSTIWFLVSTFLRIKVVHHLRYFGLGWRQNVYSLEGQNSRTSFFYWHPGCFDKTKAPHTFGCPPAVSDWINQNVFGWVAFWQILSRTFTTVQKIHKARFISIFGGFQSPPAAQMDQFVSTLVAIFWRGEYLRCWSRQSFDIFLHLTGDWDRWCACEPELLEWVALQPMLGFMQLFAARV